MAGPTTRPFAKAFACAGVAFVVIVVAALAVLGPPANTYYAGRLAGRLFAAVAIAALVTGFFARRGVKAWSIWRIIAIYTVAFIAIVVLQAIGATAGHQ